MTIETIGVKKEFQYGEKRKLVNDEINLSVEQGDFIGIIGRSGSGKSTFLNMLCGLIRPTAGEILFDGESILKKSDKELSKFRNERIGYVMQDVCLLPNYTVMENIMLPNYLFKRSRDSVHTRAEELLKKMDIDWAAKNYPHELSGGEMRRVAIARAMINRPALLIFDEATNDLDEATESEIMNTLSQMNEEGLTILMVSHRSINISYAGIVYEMQGGKLQKVR